MPNQRSRPQHDAAQPQAGTSDANTQGETACIESLAEKCETTTFDPTAEHLRSTKIEHGRIALEKHP